VSRDAFALDFARKNKQPTPSRPWERLQPRSLCCDASLEKINSQHPLGASSRCADKTFSRFARVTFSCVAKRK